METLNIAIVSFHPNHHGFRSDYEGWKPQPYSYQYQHLQLVLEVTMRDGNLMA